RPSLLGPPRIPRPACPALAPASGDSPRQIPTQTSPPCLAESKLASAYDSSNRLNIVFVFTAPPLVCPPLPIRSAPECTPARSSCNEHTCCAQSMDLARLLYVPEAC